MDLKERKKKDHLRSFKLCSQLAAKDKNHKRSLFFLFSLSSFMFYWFWLGGSCMRKEDSKETGLSAKALEGC